MTDGNTTLHQLLEQGQSPWIDNITRDMLQNGTLQKLIDEGIVGLTRGFMYAGAPRVIVSMWSVNDRATE